MNENKREIKICEAFAGYGSQSIALKNLNYDISKDSAIVEWYTDAILAYNTIHGNYNYSKEVNWESRLKKISSNSKDLKYKTDQVNLRQFNEDKKKYLNSIKKNNNYVDINDFKFEDKYDLFTYSFPCQDLSLQGKQQGIKKGTRSGLLLVVEQKIEECFNSNKEILPTWLLMENVTALVSEKHLGQLHRWIKRLEEFGYYSKYFKLKASDCGSPQKRDRVFMVSCNDKSKFETFKIKYDEININNFDDIRLKPKDVKMKYLKSILEPINKIKLTNSDLYLNYFDLEESSNGILKMGHWNKFFDFEKHNRKNIQISNNEVYQIWDSNLNIKLFTSDKKVFNNKDNTLDEINKYVKNNKVKCVKLRFPKSTFVSKTSTNAINFIKNVVDDVFIKDKQLFNKFGIEPNYMERFSNYSTNRVVDNIEHHSRTIAARDSDPFILHTTKIKHTLNINSEFDLSDIDLPSDEVKKIVSAILEKGYIIRYLRTIEKGKLMGLSRPMTNKIIKKLQLEKEKNNISKKAEKLFGNSISIESLETIFGLMEI